MPSSENVHLILAAQTASSQGQLLSSPKLKLCLFASIVTSSPVFVRVLPMTTTMVFQIFPVAAIASSC